MKIYRIALNELKKLIKERHSENAIADEIYETLTSDGFNVKQRNPRRYWLQYIIDDIVDLQIYHTGTYAEFYVDILDDAANGVDILNNIFDSLQSMKELGYVIKRAGEFAITVETLEQHDLNTPRD